MTSEDVYMNVWHSPPSMTSEDFYMNVNIPPPIPPPRPVHSQMTSEDIYMNVNIPPTYAKTTYSSWADTSTSTFADDKWGRLHER